MFFRRQILVFCALLASAACKTKSSSEKPGPKDGGGGGNSSNEPAPEQKPFTPPGSGACQMNLNKSSASLTSLDTTAPKPSNAIWIIVKRDSGSSYCAATLGRSNERLSAKDPVQENVFYPDNSGEISIPVIQTAAHCFRYNSPGGVIREVIFRFSRDENDKSPEAHYFLTANKSIGEFHRFTKDGPVDFYVNLSKIAAGRDQSLCEKDTRAHPQGTVCFSRDDVVKISPFLRERETIPELKQNIDSLFAKAPEDQKETQIDWYQIFSRPDLPTLPGLKTATSWLSQLESLPQSQFEQQLKKEVLRLEQIRPILPNGSASTFQTDLPKVCGESSVEADCFAQFYRVDKRVESIRLASNPARLIPGHSGTLASIDVRTQTNWSIVEQSVALAPLSTVSGEPVCAGDDLLCCEKAQ